MLNFLKNPLTSLSTHNTDLFDSSPDKDQQIKLSKPFVRFSWAIGLVGIAIIVFSTSMYLSKNSEILKQRALDEEMVGLTQSVAKNATRAIQGDKDALQQLEENRNAFIKIINESKADAGSVSDEESKKSLAKLTNTWAGTENNIDLILRTKGDLNVLQNRLVQAENDLIEISKYMNLVIQGESNTEIASKRTKETTQLMKDKLQEMMLNVVGLQGRSEVSPEMSFRLTKDIASFRTMLKDLEQGNSNSDIQPLKSNDARNALANIKKFFIDSGTESNLLALAASMDNVQHSKELGTEIYKSSDVLLNETKDLIKAHQNLEASNRTWVVTGVLGALIVLGAIAFYFKKKTKIEQLVAKKTLEENESNREAIKTLVSEIEGLGRGDLRIQASVGNKLTNQIAKSFNSTVEELRKLVYKVRETADTVADHAESTNEISVGLNKSAVEQEEKIDNLSKEMSNISQELDSVAQKTSGSADLAVSALELSKLGGKVVQETIQDLNSIRDTVQETSKRIKSLGEAAQEIGEVIPAIRDMRAKIEILALNASIQAAEAGESGLGFAQIAEEVEALAKQVEREAEKIENTVKNMQVSTKEAISTMEKTTGRVVEGTKTADNAGHALKEIGENAVKLKESMDEITAQMEQGSEKATDLALDMSLVKSFTKTTKEQTVKSKETVESMTNSTKNLQESVKGFQLDNMA